MFSNYFLNYYLKTYNLKFQLKPLQLCTPYIEDVGRLVSLNPSRPFSAKVAPVLTPVLVLTINIVEPT